MSGKYVAGEGSGEDQPKAFVSINWVLTEEPLDVETDLALGFLDYLLLGTSASPLRKVLLFLSRIPSILFLWRSCQISMV